MIEPERTIRTARLTDRQALASLLKEMAMRLTGELQLGSDEAQRDV